MQLYCSMCTYIAPCMDSYTLRLCPPICITLPPILALFLPSEKWWLYNLCSHPWAFTDIGKTASTFSFISFSYSRSFLVDIHTHNNTILFCCIFSQSGIGSISGYATLIVHVSGHQYIALPPPVDAPAVRKNILRMTTTKASDSRYTCSSQANMVYCMYHIRSPP